MSATDERRWWQVLVPPGSRRSRFVWLVRLTVLKMREGPGPWFRAVRRGLFDLLPERWKAALARRRLGVRDRRGRAIALPASGHEPSGLVSVVLPVYNQADLLPSAIESVLAQTWHNLELIVVDDGSTDAIEGVLTRYRAEPRVHVLRQENLGLPKALSNGFEFACGEFRTWTSADNLMEPLQLERLVGFLRSEPAVAMVYADYLVVDAQGEPLRGTDFRPQNRRSPDAAEVHLPRSTAALNLVQDNFIGPCFLYRAWLGRALGEYAPLMGMEDYDYWMRINAQFVVRHLGSDELLYRYRWHENSLSGRTRELRLADLGRTLMEKERRRAAWRAAPRRLLVDDGAAARLGGAPPGGEEPARWNGGFLPGAGKQIAVLTAGNLPPGALAEMPPDCAALLLWDDSATPHRRLDVLRGDCVLHAACDTATAASLALYTDQVLPPSPGPPPVDAALRCLEERLFHARFHDRAARHRPLPRAWSSPPPRVLLQVEDFAEGGLERVVLDLATGLAHRGFRTVLAVLGRPGRAKELATRAGVEVHLDPSLRGEEDYRRFLQTQHIDVVHAHHSLSGAATAREAGVPFVQTVHNSYVWMHPDDIAAYRRADADTSAYVCVSPEVALYCQTRLGLSIDKAIVLMNGVRLPPPPAAGVRERRRHELGLAPDDFVFLNVASVHPSKGQRFMARALAAVRRARPEIRIVVLGDVAHPRYADELRGDLRELDLADALLLAGRHSAVAEFHAAADAFLLPSLWEGCSLALAEALAAGLPVVATDVGAARWQIHAGEGELVPPPFASIEELDVASLDRWLRGPHPDFVAALGHALLGIRDGGRRRTPDAARLAALDVERMIDGYADLFRWLVQGGSPAGARPWSRRSLLPGDPIGDAMRRDP